MQIFVLTIWTSQIVIMYNYNDFHSFRTFQLLLQASIKILNLLKYYLNVVSTLGFYWIMSACMKYKYLLFVEYKFAIEIDFFRFLECT